MDKKTTFLITFICAVAVGNLYDAQPVLVEIADAFNASYGQAGWIATLAQVGYGLGVLFVVPLGDVWERRNLITGLLLAVACAMAWAGSATSLTSLMVAQFAVGLTTITPQILIPYAATLASEKQRATVLGTIQSGLLVGILLARTFAGGVASLGGWRSIFYVAAGLSLILAGLVRSTLPAQTATTHVRYGALLRSMMVLLGQEPVLRRAALASALSFAAFSAFWTTLAFLLHDAYHMGPAVVGLFGLVGVAGAVGAQAAGRISDAQGPAVAQRLAGWLTFSAFALFLGGAHSLAALVFGVVVMDAGVQASHLALQAEVFSLQSDARSRLNGMYMFVRFVGGACGSLAGAYGWLHMGWPGVCLVGAMCSGLSLVSLKLGPHAPHDRLA